MMFKLDLLVTIQMCLPFFKYTSTCNEEIPYKTTKVCPHRGTISLENN